ncbi:MAG: phosphate ABC transporter substrate-binding/OmpA family protein [Bryobacteraceae bacterium]|jgi:phosphate transport system substrate-binding protein
MPQEKESKGRSAGLLFAIAILLLIGGGVALWRLAPNFLPNLLQGTTKAAAPAPPEVILSMHGSNTIGAQLAGALAEAFLKREGAQAVSTTPGAHADEYSVVATLPGETRPKSIEIQAHGSATAFTDMAAGKCEIGMSSRPIKPEEAATLTRLGEMTSPQCEHVVGLDGLAIIVNKSNSVSALSKAQLASIFTGETTDWRELGGTAGPIQVLSRDDKSGTYDTFKALILGKGKLAAAAVRIEDSRELSDRVAADPNAIGFIGLPYIRSAKAIAVSEPGVAPLVPNRLTVATEDYLLSRRLFFYVAAAPSSLVRRFVEFALGSDGQDIVAHTGFVELNVKAGSATAAANSTPEYMSLIAKAQRLSLNFRFRPGSTDLDNRALVDLDRVSGFLSDPAHQHGGIILCGFADSVGTPDTNQALALSRATAVAAEFKRRGMVPAAVSAFGATNPVASNKTEEGRQKNRRVEVWMRTM